MKLIFESWRKYLDESYDSASTLMIFDFDATIARTVGYTMANGPGGEVVKITTQKQYDQFKDKKGWTFDFSNLKKLAFINDDPGEAEIKAVTSVMKSALNDSEIQIMVLTARESAVEGQIQDYLNDVVGISLDMEYIKGMAGASKGAYVYGLLEKYPNINKVVFYDDSMSNINSVQSALSKAGEQQMIDGFKLYLVDDNGRPNEVG